MQQKQKKNATTTKKRSSAQEKEGECGSGNSQSKSLAQVQRISGWCSSAICRLFVAGKWDDNTTLTQIVALH